MTLAAANNPVTVPMTGSDIGLADAGAYYTAINPTSGTGIVGPVSVTLSEILALMTIFNSGSLDLHLRYLRLRTAVVGTTGAGVRFVQAIDQGNRFTSGGTPLTVNNTRMGSPNQSGATVNFGALVTTAASVNRRLLATTLYKPTIEVVEDIYQFSWGSAAQLEDPCSLINNTTTLSHVTFSFAPVVIGPGNSFVLHQWRAAITVGITFEVELGLVAK